jgi:hypothetical protein
LQLYVDIHIPTLCYVNRTYGFISDLVALCVIPRKRAAKNEIPESKEDGQNKKEKRNYNKRNKAKE